MKLRSTKNQMLCKKIAAKMLYGTHVLFMMCFLFSGFFLPIQWVVLTYLLIDLSINYYGACPLTLVQEKIDEDWPEGQELIPQFFIKYLNYELSDVQYSIFSYFMMMAPVYVAVLKVIAMR
ncbi:hypothetical protein KA529_01725 [Candidatus Saccharibacteria bacterium]|nr:hypothetical protein [Candidatus Saccharibacteria bacterium]